MPQIKEYIELGALATTVIVISLAIISALLKYYTNKKQVGSIAGISFEERIASLESKQVKLETNHLEHVWEELRSLNKGQTDLATRVAIIETKINQ